MPSPILSAGPIARARNGVIGRGGKLPWRLKTDLAIFRAVTMGKPVIMGRKTWESLPKKPLIGRTNIVLSRDGSFEPHGAVVCEEFTRGVAIAREQAAEDDASEVCVIGGASLFALALPRARRLYLTEIDAEVEGDVTLDPIDENRWRGDPRGVASRVRRRPIRVHFPGVGAHLTGAADPQEPVAHRAVVRGGNRIANCTLTLSQGPSHWAGVGKPKNDDRGDGSGP